MEKTEFTPAEITKIVDRLMDGEQMLMSESRFRLLRSSAERHIENDVMEAGECDPIFLGRFTGNGKVLLALY